MLGPRSWETVGRPGRLARARPFRWPLDQAVVLWGLNGQPGRVCGRDSGKVLQGVPLAMQDADQVDAEASCALLGLA